MKTLILPDVHDGIKTADKIIHSEPWDKLVFLGDAFDNFHTDIKEAKETAAWYKNLLEDQNVTALLGNHDLHYLWPWCVNFRCSGYTKTKSAHISSILDPMLPIRNRVMLFTWVDGWLLTHAGLSNNLVPSTIRSDINGIKRWLETESKRCMDGMFRCESHGFIDAGDDRGGRAPVGGLIWLDWSSFVHVSGVNQIFGHTLGFKVRNITVPGSHNFCIDTQLRDYAIIEDGELSIKEVACL